MTSIPYPISLFSRIWDENAPNGIRILVADRIIPKNPEMIALGFTACKDGYYQR